MGNEGFQFDLGGAGSPAPIPLAHLATFSLGPLTVAGGLGFFGFRMLRAKP